MQLNLSAVDRMVRASDRQEGTSAPPPSLEREELHSILGSQVLRHSNIQTCGRQQILTQWLPCVGTALRYGDINNRTRDPASHWDLLAMRGERIYQNKK